VAFVISCILFAAALPYAFVLLSCWPSQKQRGRWGVGYDNHQPRESQERFEGWRKRAHYAQLNGYEAFAPFAFGLLCAELAGVPRHVLHGLGVGFLVARVLHGLFYVLDRPSLRSIVWSAGLACALLLYVAALYRLA
jgi:uncharacterized MAPEG superfamily protein